MKTEFELEFEFQIPQTGLDIFWPAQRQADFAVDPEDPEEMPTGSISGVIVSCRDSPLLKVG